MRSEWEVFGLPLEWGDSYFSICKCNVNEQLFTWHLTATLNTSPLEQTAENVLHGATADGSRGIKAKAEKHISANASVGGGCCWLPGSYVQRAVDLEDRLDVQLLSLCWTMSSAQEHWIPPHHWRECTDKKTQTKKLRIKILAQVFSDSWGQRDYFPHLYIPKVFRQAIKQLL